MRMPNSKCRPPITVGVRAFRRRSGQRQYQIRNQYRAWQSLGIFSQLRLNARDYFAQSIPEYRENQFGATLGFPIISQQALLLRRYRGEPHRAGQPHNVYRPNGSGEAGNFTELLNPAINDTRIPIQLYQPGSVGGPGGTSKQPAMVKTTSSARGKSMRWRRGS
jgi:hypothetical protein